MAQLKYRKDIEGLRGISVLAVIFYHYHIGGFTGGFVGVDIFFVISGYLITSIIINDIHNNRFSFFDFYTRRIRRIVPASLFVTLCTLLAGYLIILPSVYSKVGESALYAAFGLSNFYFLWNTGYFDTIAEFQPLLHTWSLAVEEQYYLFWPILLLGIVNVGKESLPIKLSIIFVLVLISLAISQYNITDNQKASFYMLDSRAWELGLGGLLALLPAIRNRITSEFIAVLGLSLIIWSIFQLDSNNDFPGLNALYPCIGAALIILPKSENFIEKAISTRPLAFVGKISYSLYLWHWPILVLYRHYGTGRMPGAKEIAIMLVLSFLLSIVSWRHIEQRFHRMHNSPKPIVFTWGAVSMAAIGLLGFTVSITSGFPGRLPEPIRNVEKLVNETVTSQNGMASCFITSKSKYGLKSFSNDDCIVTNPNRRNVLIVGDSHAAHFSKALRDIYPDIKFSQITGSGCVPVLHAKGKSTCSVLMRLAIDESIPNGKFDTVIFSARWQPNHFQNLVKAIDWTKKYVKEIIVLGPTIEYTKALPTLLAKSALRKDDGEIVDSARRYRHAKNLARSLVSSLKGHGISYYSVIESICPKRRCLTVDRNGRPVQFDYGHFTYNGARLVIEDLKKKGLLKPRV